MSTAVAAPQNAPTTQPAVLASSPADEEAVRYRLSRGCTASVVFSGAITQSAIDKLRAHLELSKDTYPENDDSDA